MKILANIFLYTGLFFIGLFMGPLIGYTHKTEWWRIVMLLLFVFLSYVYLRGRRFHNIENHNTWKVFRKNR